MVEIQFNCGFIFKFNINVLKKTRNFRLLSKRLFQRVEKLVWLQEVSNNIIFTINILNEFGCPTSALTCSFICQIVLVCLKQSKGPLVYQKTGAPPISTIIGLFLGVTSNAHVQDPAPPKKQDHKIIRS
jgi:hypothetical protein